LAVEFSCCRIDAGRIGDVHGRNPQFGVIRVRKAVQFRSGCWITTGCIDLPSLSEVLAREFEPESSISTGD
jgi:hypothetical protein